MGVLRLTQPVPTAGLTCQTHGSKGRDGFLTGLTGVGSALGSRGSALQIYITKLSNWHKTLFGMYGHCDVLI